MYALVLLMFLVVHVVCLQLLAVCLAVVALGPEPLLQVEDPAHQLRGEVLRGPPRRASIQFVMITMIATVSIINYSY